MIRSIDFDRPTRGPFEWSAVEGHGDHLLPEALRRRVLIHTVHDGGAIAAAYRRDAAGNPLVDPAQLERSYIRERDWGANLVAHNLAQALGTGGYGRVTVARVLLDFNRFPGTSPPGTDDPLERLAINAPFAQRLQHHQKMSVLDLYDEISRQLETHLADKLLIIGVHTYDERNASQTSRPHLSLITRPAGYQRESRLPYGVFDPIYPDRLAESTCSRILRDRMSLELERGGFRVSGNHPYALPEGSVEVRSQVWFFFRDLRRRWEAFSPQSRSDPAYALVWTMLLNTNLRQGRAEALRGHLQRYRKPEPSQAELFERAVAAYGAIAAFIDQADVVNEFRRNPDRPSSLALEVRKDLVCEMDDTEGRPTPPTGVIQARAQRIAGLLAQAIGTYFDNDRPAPATASP